MSHSKLLLPEQDSRSRSRSTPAEASARKNGGPGNRDLLAAMGVGKAMPGPVRASMEESLGADFSGVRLYESPLVDEAGALAAASGNHVAFAPGKLDFHSSAGLELLGHELSHVASQARGEVSGNGLIQDTGLERRADLDGAKAMRAFDPASGGDLTPMSAGPAPSAPSGPIQAKKRNKMSGQEKAERFRDSLANMTLKQQVSTMRNMAQAESVLPEGTVSEEEKDMIAAIQRGFATNTDFLDEFVGQQIQAAQALNTARSGFLDGEGGALDEDRATYLSKYSREATELQGYSTLLMNMGMVSDSLFSTQYIARKLDEIGQTDPGAVAAVRTAQNILLSDNKKNTWANSEEGGLASSPQPGVEYRDYIRNAAQDRDTGMAQSWYQSQNKPGLLSRLFRRRRSR